MVSITEDNKLKNCSQQESPNSGSDSGLATASMSTTQTFKKRQNNNNNTTEEKLAVKRTKNRRPTKVGLNDTLRRIRQLMVEGRSKLEIQNILQLEERTYYRYMTKIHEIDQALFEEQGKKTPIKGFESIPECYEVASKKDEKKKKRMKGRVLDERQKDGQKYSRK